MEHPLVSLVLQFGLESLSYLAAAHDIFTSVCWSELGVSRLELLDMYEHGDSVRHITDGKACDDLSTLLVEFTDDIHWNYVRDENLLNFISGRPFIALRYQSDPMVIISLDGLNCQVLYCNRLGGNRYDEDDTYSLLRKFLSEDKFEFRHHLNGDYNFNFYVAVNTNFVTGNYVITARVLLDILSATSDNLQGITLQDYEGQEFLDIIEKETIDEYESEREWRDRLLPENVERRLEGQKDLIQTKINEMREHLRRYVPILVKSARK